MWKRVDVGTRISPDLSTQRLVDDGSWGFRHHMSLAFAVLMIMSLKTCTLHDILMREAMLYCVLFVITVPLLP